MTHPCVVRERGRRGGFTLVEVLIAAFIIALGVLGLLALFAGAAKQQQTASQTTVSVLAARNAEAVLARNFGALRTPPNMSTLFTENVWYPLPMDAVKRYLTVNPGGGSNGPYFLVAPATPMPYALYVDAGTPVVNDPGFTNGMPDGPWTSLIDFGQRRIDPLSLSIRVTFMDDMGNPWPGVSEVTYSRQGGVNYGIDAPLSGLYAYTPLGDTQFTTTGNPAPLGGAAPGPPYPLDYFIVDVQQDPDGTNPAMVNAMNLAPLEAFPTCRVSKIELLDYKWRNDQLVSLSDRLYVRSDSSAPGGRRPFLSYSVLYRRTASASQMAVFTYELIPPSSSAQYIPPETAQKLSAGEAPLRKAAVELRFDTAANRYYIEVQNADAWVVEPGQILLVEGRQNPSTTPAPIEELGSDLPVQVIRKSANGTRWRGDLDRSPRAGGGSFLDPQQRTSGGKQDLTVFAVNDVVTSEADGSLWRLKPLEARMFQILNSN